MTARTLLVTSPSGQTMRVRAAKAQLTVGRSTLSDVVIDDAKASRSHARIHLGANVLIEDLGSSNGTMVGDERITSRQLRAGEVIRIGDHSIQVDVPAADVDFDRTILNTEADIEPTLVANPLEIEVSDTTVPRIVVTMGSRTWEVPLQDDATVFGRSSECDVPIESPRVSRAHAQVERAGDGFRLRDLGSSNGTWMDGRRIDIEQLRHGATFSLGEARCVFKAPFSNDDLTIVDSGARPRGTRRPVVFVPGLMGSTLYRGDEMVWPNVMRMLTEPDLFRYPGTVALQPRGLVSDVVVIPNLVKQNQYNRLTEFLCEGLSYEVGKDLLPFAYDWRQDVRVSARQLGEAITQWGVQEPITIVAHSLGTLVSRYYVDCLGGRRHVERVIFLGGGHYGTPKSLVILSQGPGFLPFGLMAERMRSVLTTFPTAHQILPVYPAVKDQQGRPVDVLADDRWIGEPQKECHALARQFRNELPERCSVPAVSIFGYGIKTVTSVTMCRDGDGRCESMDFVVEEHGDGVVPQVAAVLKGTEVHPVRQHHGALYTDKDVQMRLKLELTR